MKDMKSQRIAEILKSGAEDTDIVVKGWVRTKRGNKNVAFIALNDGSCVANIQIVVDLAKFGEEQLKPITTGACIRVDGRLVASLGSGQRVEVQAEKIEIYGTADPETYPLQKKGHSLEFLRDIAYLRPRTNTFGAVLRIRQVHRDLRCAEEKTDAVIPGAFLLEPDDQRLLLHRDRMLRVFRVLAYRC